MAERTGGILKTVLGMMVHTHSVLGLEGMSDALAEAVTAYNMDTTEDGVSPLQAVTERQPRLQGDVLGNFHERLAEHSLIQTSLTWPDKLLFGRPRSWQWFVFIFREDYAELN